MVCIDTGKIVDLIPSRDYFDVKQWLIKYPNINLVSHDGSITYRNAIVDAYPYAKQVNDRFHLLKNLTDYTKEYLKKSMGLRIKIITDDAKVSSTDSQASPPRNYDIPPANKNRMLTLEEKYKHMLCLIELGYSKTTICKSLNMDIRAYNKLMSANKNELANLLTAPSLLNHEEKVAAKIARVSEVRNLKSQGVSLRGITRITGLNFQTVRKYIDDNFNPVHASYGKKKHGILTPFITEIDGLLSQGIMGSIVESKIREAGYTGSSSNLRKYLSDWKRMKKQNHLGTNGQDSFEIIERKNLFKLLYNKSDRAASGKPKGSKVIPSEQLSKVFKQYPCFQKIHDLIWDFRRLLNSKNADFLQPWLDRAKSLNIREINSFTEGITRDLDAVKNAIVLPYSNGLAEGKINKLKVIKRIMYGRCSFEMLRAKVLQLENF